MGLMLEKGWIGLDSGVWVGFYRGWLIFVGFCVFSNVVGLEFWWREVGSSSIPTGVS